ncbi:uncharacterized protein LOC143034899 [Oratosquilla oratoria]|uniref:uncharacterized protein LOC143034899 n=1 Tax=Oratosquilla oratoria TaxID=337810 RepID=UPI003F772742
MEKESGDNKKKRLRHFWMWVTKEKGLEKKDVNSNVKFHNKLRGEHSTLFPHLYAHDKKYWLTQDIKDFHHRLLSFNKLLRENKDYDYSDAMFDTIPLLEEEIKESVFEGFQKHYFAGYKNFVSNGGKSCHRAYQMHYLEKTHKNFKVAEKRNKYAIKKVQKELEAKKKEKEEEEHRQRKELKREKEIEREREKEEIRVRKEEEKELERKKKEKERQKIEEEKQRKKEEKELEEKRKEEERLKIQEEKELERKKKEKERQKIEVKKKKKGKRKKKN